MHVATAETPVAALEHLLEGLARCKDPWARHWLVVPGAGRSEWLQRQWAKRAGIASRSEVISLRALLEQAASPKREPFSLDRLVLTVAQVLPSFAGEAPLPDVIADGVLGAARLAWAQQLASALDGGLLARTDAQGGQLTPLLARLVQHQAVREALSGHLGALDAALFQSAAQAWAEKWQGSGGVPHLWIHLDSGLPAVLLRRLTELLTLLPADRVHLSLLLPAGIAADAATQGPLLHALGRRVDDLSHQAATAFVANGATVAALSSPSPTSGLLGLIQSACRAAPQPASFEGVSRSFTVHGCRSALRELEVCRDRIQQAMAADSTLTWDDFLVLLGDPATQFPLVPAAFQPLPIRAVGLGGNAVSLVASALERLLTALPGRLGLVDFQGLIEEPLIAQRFGLAEDTTQVVQWLQDANFRWGLDASQRAAAQGGGENRWSAEFALRRLGIGAVVETALRDALVDATVPLERATGLAIPSLAGVARLTAALARARAAWEVARTLPDWCDWLSGCCDEFLAPGAEATIKQRTKFLNLLLPALKTAAPEGLLMQNDAFRRLVNAQLATLTDAPGAAGGGVTVADLRHYGGTPARFVLVAGLGAETFPRRDEWPAWHPLSTQREPGDPSQRDDDRHALLLAILACSQRLVLTYQDGSDEDSKERPPSTPLADLLAVVEQVALPPGGVTSAGAVLLHHGLNGFSPANFGPDTTADVWSFGEGDHAGAVVLSKPHERPYAGLWAQPLPEVAQSGPLTFADLKALFVEPCGIFLARLGLRLPEEGTELSQLDVLKVGGLEAWGLADRMLQTVLTGGDVDALRRGAEAAGELPRGRYGERIWNDLCSEIPAAPDETLEPLTETLQLQIAGRALTVTLPAGWYRAADGAVHFRSASKPGTKHQLAVKLTLLCLAHAGRATQATVRFRTQANATVIDAPPPASSQRATRICFRGLEDPFGAAQSIETDLLPDAAMPLAWRLFGFVSAFERAFVRAES